MLRNLISAIKKSNMHEISTLLADESFDINQLDTIGMTPLAWAASVGNESTVYYLLARRANINLAAANVDTPLIAALRNKHWDIANKLLESNADVVARGCFNMSALTWAVVSGDIEIVKKILSRNPGATHENQDGHTAFTYACLHNKWNVAELLLAFESDINHITKKNMTALHYAIHAGNCEVIQNLLEKGADVNLLEESDLNKINTIISETEQKAYFGLSQQDDIATFADKNKHEHLREVAQIVNQYLFFQNRSDQSTVDRKFRDALEVKFKG